MEEQNQNQGGAREYAGGENTADFSGGNAGSYAGGNTGGYAEGNAGGRRYRRVSGNNGNNRNRMRGFIPGLIVGIIATVIGVGIAVRGICASDGRTVVNSFGALNRENYPLCERFEEATGRPCFMANNVRALFAAHCFSAREAEGHSQFFLRCEYGIGASLSIDGKIWHGVTEQCAEIGHIPVVRRGGKPCSCGKSGCLETIASPTAIREDALKILSEENTPILWNLVKKKGEDVLQLELADVFAAAKNGDAQVAEIVDRAASALAMALKSVIYLVDPEKIVLYGKMFEDSYYLSRLLAEMQEGVDGGHAVSVEKSRFNQQLETKAAGLVAVDAFFRNGGIPAA